MGCADGFGDALVRGHACARAGLLNVVQPTGGMQVTLTHRLIVRHSGG